MEDLQMLDKKTVTGEAVKMLFAIMRTCPPTVSNGGAHAKSLLAQICGNGLGTSGFELRSLASGNEACGCEGEGRMDVYSHLLLHVEGDIVDKSHVSEYFAGQVHAAKIFQDARKEFTHEYALKVVYGHLLVPVYVEDIEEGIGRDYYGNAVSGLLRFPDARFVNNDLAAMHYGFLVDKLSSAEAELIAEANLKSGLFMSALEELNGFMDFSKMLYRPRSLAMAREG